MLVFLMVTLSLLYLHPLLVVVITIPSFGQTWKVHIPLWVCQGKGGGLPVNGYDEVSAVAPFLACSVEPFIYHQTTIYLPSIVHSHLIIGAVSDKCLGFFKCLRFSKSGFATFSNSAGHQKWPALSASNRWSMIVMATTIKSILALLLTFAL